MNRPPAPRPLLEYLRDLIHAKAEQRQRDAQLPFEEKIAIVLELQEASALLRAARRQPQGPAS